MGDVESQERAIWGRYEPNISCKHVKCHNEAKLCIITINIC